jgi:O-acetylserine/cysteine efflux transporter
MEDMHRRAIIALATAGALWGLTVPLSKLSMGWFGPAWLAAIRFAVVAPALALIGRRGLRQALDLRVAASGAVGFGLVVVLQNAGIQHTSVTHAAVVIGAVPVLVALIGVGFGATATRPITWAGYGLALGGVSLVAGTGGGGASSLGDLLVLASAALSAAYIFVAPSVLEGRDAAAVTAVQAGAGALTAAPVALLTEGAPHIPLHLDPLLALLALCALGTLLPFWLFAFGQARVPAQLAGAYLNLEPVVGAAVGWLAFGDAAAPLQVGGALAVLGGIALSTVPAPAADRPDARGVSAARRGPARWTVRALGVRSASLRVANLAHTRGERARPPLYPGNSLGPGAPVGVLSWFGV